MIIQNIIRSLSDFCLPLCSREQFILNFLNKHNILNLCITLHKERHFIIPLNKKSSLNYLEGTFLIAHYDRVQNSPGANDNSASVISLLYLALLKHKSYSTKTSYIILCPQEEAENSIKEKQGSYYLMQYLKNYRNLNTQSFFFVFDLCGIGNTFLCSETIINLLEYKNPTQALQLKKQKEYLKKSILELNFFLLPLELPFSDDLGLFLAQIPSLQITNLPEKEAIDYFYFYKKSKLSFKEAYQKAKEEGILPRTWKLIHTVEDTVENLEEEALRRLFKLLLKLIS